MKLRNKKTGNTIKDTLIKAINEGADLCGADLCGAAIEYEDSVFKPEQLEEITSNFKQSAGLDQIDIDIRPGFSSRWGGHWNHIVRIVKWVLKDADAQSENQDDNSTDKTNDDTPEQSEERPLDLESEKRDRFVEFRVEGVTQEQSDAILKTLDSIDIPENAKTRLSHGNLK